MSRTFKPTRLLSLGAVASIGLAGCVETAPAPRAPVIEVTPARGLEPSAAVEPEPAPRAPATMRPAEVVPASATDSLEVARPSATAASPRLDRRGRPACGNVMTRSSNPCEDQDAR